jgi:hypothetical protein
MGAMGHYPSRRDYYPPLWVAHTDASPDTPPVPVKTADRVRAIRTIFLQDFGGHATVDDVGAASEDAGVLDALQTPRSMREAVLEALRGIASPQGAPRSTVPAQTAQV